MSSEVAKKIWTRDERGKQCQVRDIASCLKAMITVVLDRLTSWRGFGFDLLKFGNGIRVEI